jgi:hypothetical protein
VSPKIKSSANIPARANRLHHKLLGNIRTEKTFERTRKSIIKIELFLAAATMRRCLKLYAFPDEALEFFRGRFTEHRETGGFP